MQGVLGAWREAAIRWPLAGGRLLRGMLAEPGAEDVVMAVLTQEERDRLKKPRPTYYAKQTSKRERMKNWKKLAAEVTKRDGKRCRVTGETHGLDLHHLLMRSLGGKDEAHNLVWLSRETHKAVHGHALKFFWKDDNNRAKTCWYEWQ
jgi:5-methylcytosine-specific restriction endonuclease McrA